MVKSEGELRMQAVGNAIACGSNRFSRDQLKEAAEGSNRAAEVALRKREALDADPRSESQRDDDELAGVMWERSCRRTGFNRGSGSILLRLERVAGELARESGKDAAISSVIPASSC